jgi:xanthosine utilization system XapX-like protein
VLTAMLKLVLTGVWVAAVALGAVYGSIELSKPADPGAEEAARKAVRELMAGEMVTFPVIEDGKVAGYFLTKTSLIVDKTKLPTTTLPIPALVTDELYTALVGEKLIRIHKNGDFNVAAFRERIKTAVNTRLGTDVVMDVIIEQVDYLSKEDIRNSQAQQKSTTEGEKIIEEHIPEDMKPDESGKAAAH